MKKKTKKECKELIEGLSNDELKKLRKELLNGLSTTELKELITEILTEMIPPPLSKAELKELKKQPHIQDFIKYVKKKTGVWTEWTCEPYK